MKEQLISFETVKLAKEKGFDISTHSYYFEDNKFKENSIKGTNGYYGDEYEFNLSEFNENWNDKWLTKKDGDRCFGCSKQQGYLETFSAPTQSLLQKWLREVHNIEVLISRIPPEAVLASKNNGKNILKNYNCYVWSFNNNPRIANNGSFQDIYEEALEIGLQEALKLIK